MLKFLLTSQGIKKQNFLVLINYHEKASQYSINEAQ